MGQWIEGIEFITEHCCECGMAFAMTAAFRARRLNDRKEFHCPAGHPQYYTGLSEAAKLRKKLEETKRQLYHEEDRSASLRDKCSQVTRGYARIRDRVKNGVCPCCNRTFQNLMQHMKKQHSEFGSNQMLRALRQTYGLTQEMLAEEAGTRTAYVSLFENEKPLPLQDKAAIETWLITQETTCPAPD